MTGEELREAAALMRSRAEAATGDGWGWRHFGDDPENSCRVVYYPPDIGIEPWVVIADDIFNEADVEHIASWHPAVALAVADWLDAESYEPETEHEGGAYTTGGPSLTALNVARTYLGVER